MFTTSCSATGAESGLRSSLISILNPKWPNVHSAQTSFREWATLRKIRHTNQIRKTRSLQLEGVMNSPRIISVVQLNGKISCRLVRIIPRPTAHHKISFVIADALLHLKSEMLKCNINWLGSDDHGSETWLWPSHAWVIQLQISGYFLDLNHLKRILDSKSLFGAWENGQTEDKRGWRAPGPRTKSDIKIRGISRKAYWIWVQIIETGHERTKPLGCTADRWNYCAFTLRDKES